jgi:hypothetical protein
VRRVSMFPSYLFCDDIHEYETDASYHLLPVNMKQTCIHFHSCLFVFCPPRIDKIPQQISFVV